MRRTIVSGRIIGRKDSVCAQIAETRMTGFSGWQRDPPAARLYAVEPVGVATQTPSACTEVKCSSSPKISMEDMAAEISCRIPGKGYCEGKGLTRVRTAIYDYIVQDLIGTIWFMGPFILRLLSN